MDLPPPLFDHPTLSPPPQIEVYDGPRIGDIKILIIPPDSLSDWSELGAGIQLPLTIW